ncbi:MFS transporter [Streptomyces sp. NBC_00249]|uniref:MFS transporter n=1 Tax=Streptomyces sp. NBC_00249 TaxID=2975690 RepID=UPI002257279C|nr:MFS transporter [Streptomyces sp. NBC_00249]MCX5199472.1 MFS transporter [Streptomyces sp. NBC_00249]
MSDATATTAKPAPEEPKPMSPHMIKWISVSALGTLLLASLDQTIVGSAAWTIARDLAPQDGLGLLPWLFTVYLLASTATQPLYGKLSDIFGPKKVFLAAISLFLVGSMLCGTAQSMPQLIVYRTVQGLGAGGLVGVTLVIVAMISPPKDRARRSGLGGAIIGGGSVAGPLLGGVVSEHMGWRWLFYINVPLGIAALAIMLYALRLPAGPRRREPVDILGAVLLAAAASIILLVTDWGGTRYAWTSPLILAMGAAGVLITAFFIWWELRVTAPILPLSLFRNPVYRTVAPLQIVTGLAVMSAPVYLATYMQIARAQTPTSSALFTVPLAAGLVLFSTSGGLWISRSGRFRRVLVLGNLLCTAALVLLGLLGAGTPPWVIAVDLFLLGSGLGGLMQVSVLAVQNSVAPHQLGVATTSVRFLGRMGQALGTALLGVLLNASFDSKLPPEVRDQLEGNVANLGSVERLPAPVRETVVDAFVSANHVLYLTAAAVSVLAVVLSFFVKENMDSAEPGWVGAAPATGSPAAGPGRG